MFLSYGIQGTVTLQETMLKIFPSDRFNLAGFLLLPVIAIACGSAQDKTMDVPELISIPLYPHTIGKIPVPQGYTRVTSAAGSFAEWLRNVPLKKDKTVYLCNGIPKPNQSAQFAVVDIPVGTKDLQQCADVVMRLRAEYLFVCRQYNNISFTDYAGKNYQWRGTDNRKQFEQYLENVFGWCGSASLEKQLKLVAGIRNLQAGDVFIKGGFPGHAMIVADVAVNNKGEKAFLLVQGYQPAQDIHVVVNPMNTALSPWYKITDASVIQTPEWTFYKNQLRRW